MSTKDTFLFVAKCLTISTNFKNKLWVENVLKKQAICWDKVVAISSGHYVLSTFYRILKKNDLLVFLPSDLVSYMAHLTDLNAIRNAKIIQQAKSINSLLLSYKIQPVFVKGTGFLLQNLYTDISERMVGDIDFVLPKEDCLKAYAILIANGYVRLTPNTDVNFWGFRHLPRLIHEEFIAGVEIHHELISKPFYEDFNAAKIFKNTIKTLDGFHFLSFENQVALSIIATQINNAESSIYNKKIRLRNTYDILLLSRKTNTLKAIKGFKKLFTPLHSYLVISKTLLESETIIIKNTFASVVALKWFSKTLYDFKEESFYKRKLWLFFMFFVDKGLRFKLRKRFGRKKWRKEKLKEILLFIGFKNLSKTKHL